MTPAWLLAGYLVVFAPCGFAIDDEGNVSPAPAPNLTSVWVAPEAVVEIFQMRYSEEHMACSLMVLSNGSRLYVVGEADDIRRRIEIAIARLRGYRGERNRRDGDCAAC